MSQPLSLTLRIRAERDGQQWAVAMNGRLKSGDYFDLFVKPNQPAYVYVIQFYADGARVLFPDGGDRQIQPGAETRLPEQSDESFQLGPTVGEEVMYVAASRMPIARVDARIASSLDEIRISGSKREREVQPSPPAAPAKTSKESSGGGASRRSRSEAPTQLPHALKVHADRFFRGTTREVHVVKRPGQATTLVGVVDKRDDALLIVRISVHHD